MYSFLVPGASYHGRLPLLHDPQKLLWSSLRPGPCGDHRPPLRWDDGTFRSDVSQSPPLHRPVPGSCHLLGVLSPCLGSHSLPLPVSRLTDNGLLSGHVTVNCHTHCAPPYRCTCLPCLFCVNVLAHLPLPTCRLGRSRYPAWK